MCFLGVIFIVILILVDTMVKQNPFKSIAVVPKEVPAHLREKIMRAVTKIKRHKKMSTLTTKN
jgi:hypothetical protein